MGETKDAEKGAPQATEQSSKGEAGITSGGEPVTYTQEQADKMVSDKLAAAGRDAKSLDVKGKALDARETAIKAGEERLTQWQKDRDAEELKAAEDNPELQTLIQGKKALRDKETGFAQREQALTQKEEEHKDLLEAANATQREISIWEIARKQGVDASELKELSTQLNLQTNEQIERVALTMTKGKTAPIKPDSGATAGGVSWRDLSPDEKIRRALSQ